MKLLSIHVVPKYQAFLPVQNVVYDYEPLRLAYLFSLQSYSVTYDPINKSIKASMRSSSSSLGRPERE